MSLVKAQCLNCGANLEVDNSKDAAICPYCKTAYIVETAIEQYNHKINSHGAKSTTDMIKDGIAQIRLEKYDDAEKKFHEISYDNPEDWRGWFGLALTEFLSKTNTMFPMNEKSWDLCPAEIRMHKETIIQITDYNKKLEDEQTNQMNLLDQGQSITPSNHVINKRGNAISELHAKLNDTESRLSSTKTTVLVFSAIYSILGIIGFIQFMHGRRIIGGFLLFATALALLGLLFTQVLGINYDNILGIHIANGLIPLINRKKSLMNDIESLNKKKDQESEKILLETNRRIEELNNLKACQDAEISRLENEYQQIIKKTGFASANEYLICILEKNIYL